MIERMSPPIGFLVKVFLEKALSHETFSQEVLSEDIEEEVGRHQRRSLPMVSSAA